MEIIKNAELTCCLFIGIPSAFVFLLVGGLTLKLNIMDDDFNKKIIGISFIITVATIFIALITSLMLK